ncbi:hypothetical protein BJY52DRAFT_1228861 [Lactarius psammicola]|nr:hypothetical protein BJY52DRAFT_1228861 [Lactarius psammicola]
MYGHPHTEHILHYTGEQVLAGELFSVAWVSSKENIGDMFTKPLICLLFGLVRLSVADIHVGNASACKRTATSHAALPYTFSLSTNIASYLIRTSVMIVRYFVPFRFRAASYIRSLPRPTTSVIARTRAIPEAPKNLDDKADMHVRRIVLAPTAQQLTRMVIATRSRTRPHLQSYSIIRRWKKGQFLDHVRALGTQKNIADRKCHAPAGGFFQSVNRANYTPPSKDQVITFSLDARETMDLLSGPKRAKLIATHKSFFKSGICAGRFVCIVKASPLSSTIKTFETTDQNVHGRNKPTSCKLLQGGNNALRIYKKFYIPV